MTRNLKFGRQQESKLLMKTTTPPSTQLLLSETPINLLIDSDDKINTTIQIFNLPTMSIVIFEATINKVNHGD